MRFNRLYFVLLVVIVFSCNDSKRLGEESKASGDDQSHLSSWIRQDLNLKEGYAINPVSGDSISPLINAFGDTVKTGVPIPARSGVIHGVPVAKMKKFLTRKPEVLLTHLNVHKVPENLTVIPVKKDALKIFTPGVDTSSYILVNRMGDTIPSGVPIQIKGKVVRSIQPQPIKALPPQVKDIANINIKYMGVEQGMNSPIVSTILEDSRGNLWFATRGGGVIMYNGQTFTHFTEKEGLSSNYVYTILEDRQGILWFSTLGGGVSRYDGETFTHFTEKEGFTCNNTNPILEDSHGNLWFGTARGLGMYNGESITHFTEKEGLSRNNIQSILEDSHGNLWFGTGGSKPAKAGGVSMYNGESFTHFTEKDGIGGNIVWSILEDSHGNLWFGTGGGGVSKYDGETFTHFTEKEGLSSNYVYTILEDRQGILWFGTIGGGVSRYDGETLPAGQASFTHFTEKEGLCSNIVYSILEDSHGILWFGTAGGVNMYNSKSFTHFTETVGLGINLVNSILEDSHGNLWFGTSGGGLCRYDGESFTSFTLKGDIRSNMVSSILEDSHGNLWFSSQFNGVIMYNGESFTHFISIGFSSNNIISILEDSHGNLWFANTGGVSMYNGETFTNFMNKGGLSIGYVLSILEDSHGNLWFGTDGGGVTRYDGETFTHFTEKEGLSNNIVNSILEDSFGNLWFGTGGGGVSVFDGKSFSILTEKENLSSNFVTSILKDDNQNIWLGTERGLNLLVFNSERIAKTNNNLFTSDARDSLISIHYQAIHSFSNQDGLKGMNFFRNSALLDSKNRIWWGSGKSLTMLDMNNFKIPDEPPSIQLNQIDIAEKFVNYRNLIDSTKIGITFDSVARFSNYPLNLALRYELNHLTFHFSAMECYDLHKIKYSYIMEGLSNDWSIPTTEAKAEYRNLAYGTFTFKVKAIGRTQIWSEPFEYTFTILPPWWHTWWARVLYGIVAFVLVGGILRQRTAVLKKRQKELEQTVEERTAELVSALERLRETQSQLVQSEKMASLGQLTAGIAHEINNPVSFTRTSSFALDQDLKDITKLFKKYRSYIQKLKQDKSEIEDFEKSIDYQTLLSAINQEISDIMEGTKRTTEIVKNLREFSHEDSEEMELADIHHVIETTLKILKSRFTTKISLTKNYDQSIGEIKCHPGQLNQVFLNLLSNALDAIEEKGEIVITTKNQGDSLLISIKDNGKGVPNEIIDKIFDPFFTTKKIGEGTGLGLSISHGIIKNHGGTISVSSNTEKKTCFNIKLPIIK